MKYLRTMVSDGTSIFPVGTVEYEGKLWLVPEWIVSLDGGWQAPARMICLEGLRYQPMPAGMSQIADFQLHAIVPRAVLEGRAPESQTSGFVVVEAPPVRFPIATGIQ